MQNLLNELKTILENDERLVVDGKLLKNKIIELGLQLDPTLLRLLLSHKSIKTHFFTEVDKVMIFDKIKFQKFISNKSFLPDSFTSFKNKIGLTANDEFLAESKEAVLSWPYKDCVLEGGQTNDEIKRSEIFWNEILAPDEIDRLLAPRAFQNFKRITKDDEKETDNILSTDNILIKGNNLFGLCSLTKNYTNQIKLIYIDPPYNTGSDSFNYNDSFNHSSWLTFMKSRLQIAKGLLKTDGSIWVNIDDDECHYLKVMMDEIFGRENFIANVIWEKKYTTANDATFFSDNHDHILVYAKNKASFSLNKLKRTAKMDRAYSNPDNHPKGNWKATPLHAKSGSEKAKSFSYTFKNGITWSPPPGTFPRFSKDKLAEMDSNNEVWFGKDGKATPSKKTFLYEMDEYSLTPKTIFSHEEVGHNHEAKEELKNIFSDNIFATPKPERLMERIIHLATKENDIVLDFFLGSGTTAAVSLKMKRQFIGIEQMEYITTITIPRLKEVLKGEQGGISQEYNWGGGNGFVFMEIASGSSIVHDLIVQAKTKKDLEAILEYPLFGKCISYKTSIQDIRNLLKEENSDLQTLKAVFVATIDKNTFSLPFSEIDDVDYKISQKDKVLTRQFYSLKF
jgi:adenine-specific DNA-methyltransferase